MTLWLCDLVKEIMLPYMETWEKLFGGKRTKRIFIAATRQNIGKTTVSIGLVAALGKKLGNVGFIKPVGQRYLIEHGVKVDEDSVLLDMIFNFGNNLQDLSPIAVERSYTKKFLDNNIQVDPKIEIREAFKRVENGREAVVIEGTGHAGVGSVFDLSNADVAKLLGSKAVIISSGGIGNPIDEVMLNKSLFDSKGVPLAGVIVNKVIPSKYEKISKYVRMGLDRLGIPVLGVVPYISELDIPTMKDIQEELDMHVLCNEEYLTNPVKKTLVGAMEVKDAVKFLEDDCMIITPGDRSDLIGYLIKVYGSKTKSSRRLAGLILSGGMGPSRRLYSALRKSTIPTLICRFDTYDVASQVHDLTVKIKTRDQKKIDLVKDTIEKFVDIEKIMDNLV